jgi:hypothetical protein
MYRYMTNAPQQTSLADIDRLVPLAYLTTLFVRFVLLIHAMLHPTAAAAHNRPPHQHTRYQALAHFSRFTDQKLQEDH